MVERITTTGLQLELLTFVNFERLEALLGWNNSLIPASTYYSNNYSRIIGTGLAVRGDGNESDSNFMQLLHLRIRSDWVKQTTDKYTSPEMQNEMVKVMALRVLRKVSANLQSASFYTVMLDEMTDVANVL